MSAFTNLQANYRNLVQKVPYRVFIIVLGLIQCFLLSGIGFGWASITLFFEREGVYASLCSDPNDFCKERAEAIQLLYTVGVFCFSMVSFPAGYILDRFGPYLANAIGTAMIFIGFLFWALAPLNPEGLLFVDEYLLGTGFIMGGGMAIFMASFRLSTLFPERSGLILGFVNAFFDASALMPFIILFAQGLFENPDQSPKSVIFLIYALIPFFFFWVSPFWGSNKTFSRDDDFPMEVETQPHYKEENINTELTDENIIANHLAKNTSVLQQIKTPAFFFIVYFFTFNNFALNFYMGSTASQIYAIESDEHISDKYIEIYGIILPFGALFGPIIGWVIDNKGLIVSSWIVITVGALGFFFAMIPVLNVQIMTFCFLSAYRPMMYSIVTCYISDLFGFQNFGKLYGMNTFINGFVNLLQIPLLAIVFDYLGGHFVIVNFVTVICLVLSYAIPIYLYLKSRSLRQSTQAVTSKLLPD